MINPGEFKLYNASAGAGKTYTLVRNIIIILLRSKRDNWFEHFLAITFTNKAANEMKERILATLYQLSDPTKSDAIYLTGLSEDLAMKPEEIQIKAKSILSNILHHYSKFSISTIDKFNLRLIKAFAQDLGLAMNFDVELENKELIEEAVNLLYSKIGEDEQLTQTLIDIALSQMDDDKSWDVKRNIIDKASILSNDVHINELSKLADFSLEDFNLFRKQTLAEYRNIIPKHSAIYQKFESILSNNGLTIQDLPGKTRGIASFFNRFKEYDVKKSFSPSPANNRDMLENGYLEKKSNATFIFDELKSLFLEALQLNQELIFKKAILKNILSISLINEIKKALDEIKAENNILLIDEFNTLISKNIQNQPSPFIYEKIGSRFRHYFIDEFQDTSTLQWENLKPLIQNAHAQDDTIMLVGDVKQSIYRWRGGNPNQMIEIAEKWPGLILENLETNWRSYENIIRFNNSLYQYLGNLIGDEKYRDAYALGSQQKSNHKSGGYVNVQFVEKNETQPKNESHLEKILLILQNLQTQGFALQEITILVRKNSEGSAVAAFLAENNIPIISSDSLILMHSPEIQLIETLLHIAFRPQEKQYISRAIILANQIGLIDTDDFTAVIQQAIEHSPKSFIGTFEQLGYDLGFLHDENLALYDFIEKVIRQFPFDQAANAYLLAFLDEVLDYSSKNESNLEQFLEYWNKRREKVSIKTPKGVDAVQIMTIHKSKGLEFPVVILPFASWYLKNNSIWIPLEKKEGQPFDSFFVDLSAELQTIEEENIKQAITMEKNLILLDAFNTLYVATTRAIEQLYIISDPPDKKSTSVNMGKYLYEFLDAQKMLNESLDIDVYGEPKRVSTPEIVQENVKEIVFQSNDWTRNLNISTNSEKVQKQENLTAYANAIHEILANIEDKDDLADALEKEVRTGLIKPEEIENTKNLISSIVEHPTLKKYFDKKLMLLNERDFIDTNGEIFRADRVIIDQNKVSILDYKTGTKSIHHQSQIDHYANFFRTLGYEIEKKILVYLNHETHDLEIVEVN
ncbi:UvrD-helicase domain-containing protein [Vaginella massiliensis]|uniref:UvrD-helicase domain-containing protein n=1 Tax=Vaginella massiliensis TaxID=1816680 RepID=UPI003750ED74